MIFITIFVLIGLVPDKVKSLIYSHHIVPNPYDCISSLKHKMHNLEESSSFVFSSPMQVRLIRAEFSKFK